MPEIVDILDIIQVGQKSFVLLSPNSLYTGGGGQPFDRGRLLQGNAEGLISSVQLFDRGFGWEIPQDSGFQIGQATLCRDELYHWEISQQHTAQHVFSGWAEKLFGWKSDGFAIQDKMSKIELLEASDNLSCYQKIERYTLETILQDIPVFITESKGDPSLRKPTQKETVRVVEIPGVDKCGCGGTHVTSTGLVGGFAILQVERKNKSAVRIWFAAGFRLGNIAKSYMEWDQKLKKWLSGDVEERLHSLLNESEQHQKLERWFWKQLTDLIPLGEKTIEWNNLPVTLPSMKIFASMLSKKGLSCTLVNEEQYFVLAGENADERLEALKKQGASGGGKGIITGKIH
jgi:Ser-tRNA(Ala) deacylase AlaX